MWPPLLLQLLAAALSQVTLGKEAENFSSPTSAGTSGCSQHFALVLPMKYSPSLSAIIISPLSHERGSAEMSLEEPSLGLNDLYNYWSNVPFLGKVLSLWWLYNFLDKTHLVLVLQLKLP